MKWLRVTKKFPCPVCGKPGFCGVREDGLIHCMRVESDRPCKSAKIGGWFHKPDGARTPPPAPKKEAKPVKLADFAPLAEKFRCALLDANGLPTLSVELGLSVEYLDEGCAGWSAEYRAYTCPMYDGRRRIIGIQLRTQKGKWTVPGSQGGLFWPKGVSVQGQGPLLLPEGFTSCGACRDMGFDAIGRFNCEARIDLIQEVVGQCPPQRLIVVVADHDAEHKTPDGKSYCPGQDGAAKIAQALKPMRRLLKVIKPPFVKDMRDWLHAGATHEMVEVIIQSTGFV